MKVWKFRSVIVATLKLNLLLESHNFFSKNVLFLTLYIFTKDDIDSFPFEIFVLILNKKVEKNNYIDRFKFFFEEQEEKNSLVEFGL